MNPNLKECKACKKMISKNAAVCPSCGEGSSSGGRVLLIIIAVILVFMIVGMLGIL